MLLRFTCDEVIAMWPCFMKAPCALSKKLTWGQDCEVELTKDEAHEAYGALRSVGARPTAIRENKRGTRQAMSEEHLFQKTYPQFWLVDDMDLVEGPFASKEEAEAFQKEENLDGNIMEEGKTIQLDREPEGVEDQCAFTCKTPVVTLSVYDESDARDLPMSEEVARELYEALGKFFGSS